MYTSLYNVLDNAGQVVVAAGDAIPESEAMRQGIVAYTDDARATAEADYQALLAARAPAVGAQTPVEIE